ncbi:MAG TPA: hypothetical protein VF418_11530 [Sphingomonadaceae bacterium]
MHRRRLLAVSASLAAIAGGTLPLFAAGGPASGPIARYDMRAGTISGIGSMGAGGRPSMATLMRGASGGGNVQHELLLRLGSSHAPTGAPQAEHFMPDGARLGKSVELVTPKTERAPTDEIPSSRPGERPTGRILIFWGCGEHAPPGQPVVIDLSKLSAGQVPPGLFSGAIPRDWGPTLENSKTFGRWPAEDGKYARPDSSLIGAHRVAGNYSPEMDFTLSHDFMAALSLSSNRNPSGSTLLSWGALPDATGYYINLFGGKQGPGGQMGDLVMWSSAASQQFGGGLGDWLSPGQVAPLVANRTVLAPATTRCTVPVEVGQAAPDFRMGTLTAFGPEEDFSYPPRPANPKQPWNLEWTARIRHRSTTSWMETQGMTMGTANSQGFGGGYSRGGDDEDDRGQQGQQQQQQCKPKKHGGFGGLGGALGGVLGGGGGRSGC